MKKYTTIILCFFAYSAFAQQGVLIPQKLKINLAEKEKEMLIASVDSLLSNIDRGVFNDSLLYEDSKELLKSSYDWFLTYRIKKDLEDGLLYSKQITNIIELEPHLHSISIVYLQQLGDTTNLTFSLKLLAHISENTVQFSLPLVRETSAWTRSTIGHVTYIHQGKLQMERAELFDRNNTLFSQKFGLHPDILDFYMCENYQEILGLLGIEYSLYENGKIRDGLGVVENTIFSIQNNEDFSHDIFHYYSEHINKQEDRNWVAEEGIAYLWGNAYYTDTKKEMISLARLQAKLQEYLHVEEGLTVYELFDKNPKIFDDLAPEVSVRSVISGILVAKVEEQYGMKGIQKLINCGSKNQVDNFLLVIEEQLSINKENFNLEVTKLIMSH